MGEVKGSIPFRAYQAMTRADAVHLPVSPQKQCHMVALENPSSFSIRSRGEDSLRPIDRATLRA